MKKENNTSAENNAKGGNTRKGILIFAAAAAVYLALCAAVFIIADAREKAAYVRPLPLPETDAEETVIADHEKININTAGADELMTLNGIGEVTAAAIIEYRTANGSFVSLDELTEIKGIGEKTLEKIRPFLTL